MVLRGIKKGANSSILLHTGYFVLTNSSTTQAWQGITPTPQYAPTFLPLSSSTSQKTQPNAFPCICMHLYVMHVTSPLTTQPSKGKKRRKKKTKRRGRYAVRFLPATRIITRRKKKRNKTEGDQKTVCVSNHGNPNHLKPNPTPSPPSPHLTSKYKSSPLRVGVSSGIHPGVTGGGGP